MNRNALIIIAKYPEAENVKTRLKGSLSDTERLSLYEKLLHKTIYKLSDIPEVDTFIAYAPEKGKDYFSRFNTGLILLHEGDLGVRMLEAFRSVFKMGYKKVSLVGADIPDLSSEIIIDSFSRLSESSLVFGPAEDGGYYLVGMNKLISEVFESVPWSSDQTLIASVKQAKKYCYTVDYTAKLSDIDTIDDVIRMGLHS